MHASLKGRSFEPHRPDPIEECSGMDTVSEQGSF